MVDSFYNLYIVGDGSQSVGCLKKFTYPSYNSTILSKNVSYPKGVTIVNDSLLYVSDTGNNCVRSITTNGTQERVLAGSATGVAGQKDGNWDVALFNNPYGITTDKMLNIYVADSGNGWIRKINQSYYVSSVVKSSPSVPFAIILVNERQLLASYSNIGIIKTINTTAISVVSNFIGKDSIDGNRKTATLHHPYSITKFASLVYFTEPSNGKIRTIDSGGNVNTLIGASSLIQPVSISFDAFGNLFATEQRKILKITISGNATLYSGTSGFSSKDGPSGVASFKNLDGIVVTPDSAGIFVVQITTNQIRFVNASKYVSTIAGNGNFGN